MLGERTQSRKETFIVAGAVAQRPGVGGHAWVFCNWVLGLKQLGYKVVFVDRLEPQMLADPRLPPSHSAEWRWLTNVMAAVGMDGDVALLCDRGRQCLGMDKSELIRRCRDAVALFNVMGYANDPDILAAAGFRVFVDIDPGFPHFWQQLGLHDPFVGHDAFVTVGLNVGGAGCLVPTCGLNWVTTVPPVALQRWSAMRPRSGIPRITSVCTWRGPYAPVDYGGTRYGLRVHELRRFVDLPARVPGARFELALDIEGADARDAESLRSHGWWLVDPRVAASSPDQYRAYLRSSAAELMVAKGMYVQARTGWFSDRSACYLASGRPVVAQDTGLAGHLPRGEGLLTFTTLEEAGNAVTEVCNDLPRHAGAARELAAEHFEAGHVLTTLLGRLGID
jgi:hypothetical protein